MRLSELFKTQVYDFESEIRKQSKTRCLLLSTSTANVRDALCELENRWLIRDKYRSLRRDDIKVVIMSSLTGNIAVPRKFRRVTSPIIFLPDARFCSGKNSMIRDQIAVQHVSFDQRVPEYLILVDCERVRSIARTLPYVYIAVSFGVNLCDRYDRDVNVGFSPLFCKADSRNRVLRPVVSRAMTARR